MVPSSRGRLASDAAAVAMVRDRRRPGDCKGDENSRGVTRRRNRLGKGCVSAEPSTSEGRAQEELGLLCSLLHSPCGPHFVRTRDGPGRASAWLDGRSIETKRTKRSEASLSSACFRHSMTSMSKEMNGRRSNTKLRHAMTSDVYSTSSTDTQVT